MNQILYNTPQTMGGSTCIPHGIFDSLYGSKSETWKTGCIFIGGGTSN